MTTPSPCSLALWGQQSFLCALLHVTCIIGRSDKRASLGGMSSKCEMEWVRGERGESRKSRANERAKSAWAVLSAKGNGNHRASPASFLMASEEGELNVPKGQFAKRQSVRRFLLLEADRHACRDESTRERASERGDPVSMQFHASAVCICSTAYRRNK